jgi:hypothetical protein
MENKQVKMKNEYEKEGEPIEIVKRTILIVTTPSKLVDMVEKYNKKYFPNVKLSEYIDDTILVRTPEPASNSRSIYALLTAGRKGIDCTSYSGNKTNEYLIGFWSCAGEGRL